MEPVLLQVLLAIAFVLAPLMTKRFFLEDSRIYSGAHILTLIVLLLAVILRSKDLAIIWPLFCAFGACLHIRNHRFSNFSAESVAGFIPFLFSLISSVWFMAGVQDWRLLGYNETWSFYAALHGSFLGWIFVGCLAFLCGRTGTSPVYLWGCYSCLALFLIVAFGIDGTPYLKRFGVVGLSLVVPFLIGFYALNLDPGNRWSLLFAILSLVSITITMGLALLYEFSPVLPRFVSGASVMVSVHGLINAVVTVPCFVLAIWLERGTSEPSADANS